MNKKFWKNKKVLITGHTGFKGSWLTLLLNSLGAKVIGYSLNPITNPNFFDGLKLKRYLLKDYRDDIEDFKKLKKIANNFKPSVVFHLAAQSSVLVSYTNPLKTVSTNVLGTANLLEVIRNLRSVKAAIIVTTDKVYLNDEKKKKFKESSKLGGFDLYSSSKAACDIIAESYLSSFFSKKNCGIAVVRSGNCIGGGDWTKDRIVKDTAEAFAKNKKLVIRSPNATRPWQHVLDPLCGYVKLAQKLYYYKKFNGSWNFGPNKKNNLKVRELVKIGKKIFKSKSQVVLQKKRFYEAENLSLDSSKSLKLLKWQIKFSDKDSLKLTFDWYKKFYKSKDKNGLLKMSLDQIKIFKQKHNIS
jgi:CDP-glucose 4,6-dehydratase